MDAASLLANAGTPLMWAGCLTLFVGNFFIGVVECWIASHVLRRELRQGPFVLANYVSMLFGIGLVYALAPLREPVLENPFRWGLPFLLFSWLLAFALTVVVESWFVRRALAAGERDRSIFDVPREDDIFPTSNSALDGASTARRLLADLRGNASRPREPGAATSALRLSLVMNLGTYGALTLIVLLLGGIEALTSFRHVDPRELRPPGGWVYYLSHQDNSVWRVRFDGAKRQRMIAPKKIQRPSTWVRLVFDDRSGSGQARLYLWEAGDPRAVIHGVVAPSSAIPTPVPLHEGVPLRDKANALEIGTGTFGFRSTFSFSKVSADVSVGYWAAEGIEIGGSRYRCETPVLALVWRSPTVLPDGKIVATLGNAVVLLNPKTMRAATLAAGYGPAVALDEPPPLQGKTRENSHTPIEAID